MLVYRICRFRWAYCQLQTLRRCFPADIRQTLDELPETLDETYKRTLLGIEKEKREYARRLFQCLAVAFRPLRVDELAEILAIRPDNGQQLQYRTDWRLRDAQETVLSACSSLIVIVNVNGSPVAQFSHFSVLEFLTSDRLANLTEDLSCYYISPRSAHIFLAQASLGVLLHLGDRVDRENIKKFPFAQYAAQHWVDHSQFEGVSSKIQDAMGRLFDLNESSFATWIWIYDIDHPFRQHMFEDRPPRPDAVPLYYATLCGFRNLVERLISNHPRHVNARGGYYGSAVNAALVKRNVEIALLLLEHGADVNTMDVRGITPLYLASRSGRRDNVESLLKHHADVNLADGQTGGTPLMVSACEGEVVIARVLLCHGATVDPTDKNGSTPLMAASRYGHLDIARLLIQSGAAVDSSDKNGSTPLMLASRYYHLDIVRLLTQSGADVNFPDKKSWTPLLLASHHGHLDIVRLLIQSSAAVNHKNNEGLTPLMTASKNGHLEIARLLIQSGATVKSRDR